MEELLLDEQKKERVILVAVATDDGTDVETSLKELEELCETAGAECIGTLIQNREKQHNATYIGKGKVEELSELIRELGADAVVTDDELSPAQLRNLEEALDIKVCDRTMIILDIFAKHAVTREGRIQVELAQLRYNLQRLAGKGRSMSRLGGGIGTRGPGEKKLEMDRRLIRDRITRLKEELEQIVKNRELLRRSRERNEVPVVAITGYTNAGKSTLLNRLSGSDILAKDMLFATLDATTRTVKLPSGQEILMTDTVGFINKLPHHLVEAFRSTLEEAAYADIILHVLDVSDDNAFNKMGVVYETLGMLNCNGKPIITAFNKVDKVENREDGLNIKDLRADKTVKISAKKGEGIDELLSAIEEELNNNKVYLERVIPYNEGAYLNRIRKYGQILSEDYRDNGVFVKAYVPRRYV